LIELDIPSGSVCQWLSTPTTFATGIKKLFVMGYGATIKRGFWGGGYGIKETYVNSARTNDVSAGANSVSLRTLSDTSRFSVGSRGLIGGVDLMGPQGYPPNLAIFEYVQITGMNPSTGVVTFSAPLKYSYKSTWPYYPYSPTNPSRYDNGGPATLYALDPSWDSEVEYRGITVANPSTEPGQTYVNARKATLTDMNFNCSGGSYGLAPTQVKDMVLNNVNQTCQMEVDKLVDNLTIHGGTYEQLMFQSSDGSNLFTMDNATLNTLNGIGRKTSSPTAPSIHSS
jgi:hypothetical protein